jgi:hypothetical protein
MKKKVTTANKISEPIKNEDEELNDIPHEVFPLQILIEFKAISEFKEAEVIFETGIVKAKEAKQAASPIHT